MAGEQTCFVIMPFGGFFDSYYREIYHPAISAAGLKPVRGDDIFSSGSIVEQIWQSTQDADILLADMTGRNPNVFYELGLAHAISKPVILISDNVEDIPFDIRSLRVIKYDKNQVNWGTVLLEEITKAISEVLERPRRAVPPPFRAGVPKSEMDSGILSTIADRLSNIERSISRPTGADREPVEAFQTTGTDAILLDPTEELILTALLITFLFEDEEGITREELLDEAERPNIDEAQWLRIVDKMFPGGKMITKKAANQFLRDNLSATIENVFDVLEENYSEVTEKVINLMEDWGEPSPE